MKKAAVPFLLIVGVIGVFALLTQKNDGGNADPAMSIASSSNVTSADGKQVIQITAKGGYLPRTTVAKANTPTVINVATNGTYDCSSSLNIPSIGYRQTLPASGVTAIEVPPQKSGSTLKGICAMGMYNFTVNFN